MTYYDTLGLNPMASADDIRASYRQLAKKLHPVSARLISLWRGAIIGHFLEICSNLFNFLSNCVVTWNGAG